MEFARHIKILATLGPGSSDPDTIRQLVDAGANAFRINMSHADHDGLKAQYQAIRRVEAKVGHPIAILVDLQGPKLRLGKMSRDADGEPIRLKKGDRFTLDRSSEPGDRTRAPLPHPQIFDSAEPGHQILIDDGRVKLQIDTVSKDEINCTVLAGGAVTDKKGVNLPDAVLDIPAMTEKDERDLDAALHLGIDWVALSFVQRVEDVTHAKRIVRGRARVMAKIEKPSALASIEQIIEAADGVMVARGDLGVELPVEKVPGAQRHLISLARREGKPVVVATQMLESMISAPVPTRAEVTDVALAVLEGADAVMLSAETAVGKFPIEAVSTMHRVAVETENDAAYKAVIHQRGTRPEPTAPDAIAAAARQVAETISAQAIVCYTKSGSTGLRIARERPLMHTMVLTPVPETARHLTLVWGLHCVVTKDAKNFADMVQRATKTAREKEIGATGDSIVITAGVPFGTPGATNILRIARLD